MQRKLEKPPDVEPPPEWFDEVRKRSEELGISYNPHFPALRSDPLALSGASRRNQTPSS
jgi:hypothetical protein